MSVVVIYKRTQLEVVDSQLFASVFSLGLSL